MEEILVLALKIEIKIKELFSTDAREDKNLL